MAVGLNRKLNRFAGRFFRAWTRDQAPKMRAIRFEPLETRQLMAGDFFHSVGSASDSNSSSLYSSSSLVSGGSQAEGKRLKTSSHSLKL